MLHCFNLVRAKGVDALCSAFRAFSISNFSKSGYFVLREYVTRPRLHDNHLDRQGYIRKSIIEMRCNFLLTHNLLNDGIHFMNHFVYANRHLYAIEQVDCYGMTNLERMRKGLRPIAFDGQELIVIHHLEQTHSGTWVVVPDRFHCKYDSVLHSQVRTQDPVRRLEFKYESKAFWKEEARLIEQLRIQNRRPKL